MLDRLWFIEQDYCTFCHQTNTISPDLICFVIVVIRAESSLLSMWSIREFTIFFSIFIVLCCGEPHCCFVVEHYVDSIYCALASALPFFSVKKEFFLIKIYNTSVSCLLRDIAAHTRRLHSPSKGFCVCTRSRTRSQRHFSQAKLNPHTIDMANK